MMIRRSVAVAIAVTFQRLVDGRTSSWTMEQQLVLKALRRSASGLKDASDADLGTYLRKYEPEQLKGVASNVKGIFHELLVEHYENTDDDAIRAELFEASNHPGSDIEFIVDGEVIREVQLKAVQDPGSILEHFSRYPDVDVLATTEVFETLKHAYPDQLESSGISNEHISQITRDTIEDLAGESLGDLIQDGMMTSIVVGGALQAKAILAGKPVEPREVRSYLELMGVGAGTAWTIDALLNLV